MGSNRRRNGLIAAGIVATVLLGIGLAVFFLVPRTPHITYGDPTYSNLVNTNTFFSINAQVPFTVDNPNYYDLQLKNLDLDIDYNGVFISNFIINNTLTFRKRANTEHVISAVVSTSDTSIIPSIQADIKAGTPLHMKFHGPARFEALKIKIKRNVSFTKDIKITN